MPTYDKVGYFYTNFKLYIMKKLFEKTWELPKTSDKRLSVLESKKKLMKDNFTVGGFKMY